MARAEFRERIRYIAAESPAGARRVRAAVQDSLRMLREYPFSGRKAVGDTREAVVPRTPFVVTYRVLADAGVVEVLRVWHGAQNRPRPD